MPYRPLGHSLIQKVRPWHHPLHESQVQGFLSVNPVTREQHLEGVAVADQPGQSQLIERAATALPGCMAKLMR